MRRAIVLAVVLVALWASPAAAHGSGAEPTNWRTRLLAVEPQPDGVDVEVIEAGARLQLTNRGTEEVLVLGYEDEPYLRIGPDGVFENRHSLATYSNRSRTGESPPDGLAVGADVPPEWDRVSSGRTARWHDHRIHFMGGPTQARDWEVPMRIGDETFVVRGDLREVPGPSLLPWLALGAAGGVAIALLARVAGPRVALLAGTAGLLVVDVVHGAGTAFVRPGSFASRLWAMVGGGSLAVVGWGLAVAALVLLARRRDDGLVAAGLAAVVIAGTGGLLELADLTRSQVPFALAVPVVRAVTVLTIGLGLAVAALVLLEVSRSGAPFSGRSRRAAPGGSRP